MPVPSDVELTELKTLKRDAVEWVEQVSAPRVHHFWEKDPCSLGKARQAWKRELKVSGATSGPLGTFDMEYFTGGKRQVPRELSWRVEPDFKTGEFTFAILPGPRPEPEAGEEEEAEQRAAPEPKTKRPEADEAEEPPPPPAPPASELVPWLRGKGYKVSAAAEKAIAPYVQAGMSVLVAEVDPDKIELIGGDRGQLSPIRYWTKQPLTKLPIMPGRVNLDKRLEVFIYVIHSRQRFEVANYENAYPPTNVELKERLGEIWVQERIGEVYATILDRVLEKHPGAFLTEFAWQAHRVANRFPSEAIPC